MEEIKAVLQRTRTLSGTPTKLSEKSTKIIQRFGSFDALLEKVNPTMQDSFCQRDALAVMGDFPTLADINQAYGSGSGEKWLVPQIADLTIFTGAKNIDKYQHRALARLLSSEYYWLKLSEFLLFFHRFKMGRYGHFFGNVDPMVITCAMRDFIAERNVIIAEEEQKERKRLEEEERKRNPPITWEEWERKKAEKGEERK